MATPKDTVWEIKRHTQAKHEILRRYLGAWFPILSSAYQRVLYIDGFCGPGRYRGGEPGSPIIALNEAIQHGHRLAKKELTFLFVDERQDRIEHLEFELSQMNIPRNFTLRAVTGDFATELSNLLDSLDRRRLQLPTFAFVDPFGFKGLPFELLCRLLQKRSTEVFVNLAIDSINRFLEHPDDRVKEHILDLFGTTKALDVVSADGDRMRALRLLYQEQLAKCARFVRYFEMRDLRDRTIYYLFFASNHPLGHLKMKEAFWKVDSSMGFRFSDATNPDQMVLLELDETPTLAKELQSRFAGQTKLVKDVRIFVEDETAFLASHMRAALRLLEGQNSIEVKALKRGGAKRRKNTYPDDVIIEFPGDIKGLDAAP